MSILLGGCCCESQAAYKLIPCLNQEFGCTHCDVTSKFWTVTLSGITACTGCDDCGDGTSCNNYSVSGINGTHLLTQRGSGSSSTACQWQIAGVGSWSVNHYNDTSCGVGVVNASGDMRITLSRFATKWRLSIEGLNSGKSPAYSMFFGEVNETVDDECLEIDTINDSNSCGVCSDENLFGNVHVAAGGVATFVTGDQVTPGRCPGGDPYYTDTDLSADVGNTIEISEDSGVCYTVTANTDPELADGTATKTNCWTTCQKCCDEDAEDC